MRAARRSHPLSIGLFVLGGLLVALAVVGAYGMHRTGRWLGSLLVLASVGGIGVGTIGLGLFRYAFE
jgi:hypothetical protein